MEGELKRKRNELKSYLCEANKTCFICLKILIYKKENEAKREDNGITTGLSSLSLLRSFCRYLKFNLDGFNTSQDGISSDQDELSFCSACEKFVMNFINLSVKQEVVQMHLEYSLHNIRQGLSNNREFYPSNSTLSTLRRDLSSKCSAKKFAQKPIVKLSRINRLPSTINVTVNSTQESNSSTFIDNVEETVFAEDEVKLEPGFSFSPPNSSAIFSAPEHPSSPASSELKTDPDYEPIVDDKNEEFIPSSIKKHVKLGRKLGKRNKKKITFDKVTVKYKCLECGKAWKSKASTVHHYNYAHEGRRYHCEHCNKMLKARSTLLLHQKRCSRIQERRAATTCTLCGKRFKDRNRKTAHEKSVHSIDLPFACDSCDLRFPEADLLRSHIDWLHLGKRFFCIACKEGFETKEGYQKHKNSCEKLKDFENGGDQEKSVHAQGLARGNADELSANNNEDQDAGADAGPILTDEACTSVNKELVQSKGSHTGSFKPHIWDAKAQSYKCRICGRNYTARTSVLIHYNTVHLKKRYPCDLCGAELSSTTTLKNHRKGCQARQERRQLHASGKKIFPCSICGKQFKLKSEVNRHEESHDDSRRHICETCGLSFKNKCSLRSHNAIHRVNHNKDLSCFRCKKEFANADERLYHGRTCEKRLNVSSIYTFNVETKRYSCCECKKEFKQAGNVQIHYLSVHKQQTYTCNICSAVFKRKMNFNRHKNACEAHVANPTTAPKPRHRITFGPQMCELCGKEFKKPFMLAQHKFRVHKIGEPSRVCDLCGEKFMNQYKLTRHVDIVHEGKTFQCPICKWRLYDRWEYARHTKNKCANIGKKWGRRRIKVSEDEENEGNKGSNNEDCETGLSFEGIQDANNSSTESTSAALAIPNVMKDD